MAIRQVDLGASGMRSSVLGMGCAAVMGRIGRKESLSALTAAYDAGITFYDTARSYGYGESEALLGEFFQGRRDSVILSTKFGIVPARQSPLKDSVRPLARRVLRLLPSVRKVVQSQIGAQFLGGQFTVKILRDSVATSLRKLRTDYIDLLFMHSAPFSVLAQDDLIMAMQALVVEGKVRRIGISSDTTVIAAAIALTENPIETFQFNCNLFDVGVLDSLTGARSNIVAVANHPFGGVSGVASSKAALSALAADRDTPEPVRAKLRVIDDAVLADLVLNAVTQGTRIQVVIASMMRPAHLQTNLAAMEQSRFTSQELNWLRAAIFARCVPGCKC